MNAKEFIRRFGWEYTVNYADYAVNINDLKKYIDAYELVQSYGGLFGAKIELSKQSILRWINPETEKLRQAITLVEEI